MAYYPYYPTYQNNGITWVQGEAGARAYMIAPNSTAQLWDSEAQVIYLKSADASGMPSMRILDYTIRDAKPPSTAVLPKEADYPTREEFDALKRQLEALKENIGRDKHEPALLTDE